MAYVIIGLLCVVGATIGAAVATSDDPGSMTPLYVGVGAVGVYVVGLMLYQWVGVALNSGLPGHGGIVQNQLLVTGTSLAVVIGGGLWVSGVDGVWRPFGEEGMGFPYAFAPVFGFLALALLTLPFRLRSAVESADELYRPLGLHISSLPRLVILPGVGDSTLLAGGTVLKGRRHGRAVEVVLESGEHTIALAGTFASVSKRPEKGLTIRAGPDGLVLRRRGGDRERLVSDLELAERYAAELSG
jgi:hypothetical protein